METNGKNYEQYVEAAVGEYRELLYDQLRRADDIKKIKDFTDYDALDKIIIGVCGGDGIGPTITEASEKVLRVLLASDIASGKIEIRNIDGLTIENRVACGKAIPDDVLEELKACHVILKGPTTTPHEGDGLPNIESANVMMRKKLDLFANVRPVKVPSEGIDWTFFRENTEGSYAVGSRGVNVNDDLALDFCVKERQGARLDRHESQRHKDDRRKIPEHLQAHRG